MNWIILEAEKTLSLLVLVQHLLMFTFLSFSHFLMESKTLDFLGMLLMIFGVTMK